jgi:hypothetical protein
MVQVPIYTAETLDPTDFLLGHNSAGNVRRFPGFASPRRRLTGDETFYVRGADGSDLNTGTADNAGGAWETIQHAIDWVTENLDPGTDYVVTIQVRAATYNEDIEAKNFASGASGARQLRIIGDETTPSNCVINCTALCLYAYLCEAYVSGFKFTGGGGAAAIYCDSGIVLFGNVEFGAIGFHILNNAGYVANAESSFSISGGGNAIVWNTNGGITIFANTVITVTGTPTFAVAGITLFQGSRFVGETNLSWVGSFVGLQFDCDSGCLIHLAGQRIPGTIKGIRGDRIFATSDLIIYVRPDGNDLNYGTANTSAGAFLTIQAAIDHLYKNYDLKGYQAIVQLANGTYDEIAVELKTPVGAATAGTTTAGGGGGCRLIGDETTPGNVTINAEIYALGSGTQWFCSGFSFTCTGGAAANPYCVYGHAEGWVRLGKVIFAGTPVSSHWAADFGGTVEFQEDYSVTANASFHGICQLNGKVLSFGTTAAHGTRTYTGGFTIICSVSSMVVWGTAFTGPVTAARYSVTKVSTISVGGNGPNFLPGNSAGTADATSNYS